MNFNKKICVLGLGYIGLPTALLLANKNYSVTGVDLKEDLVKNLNKKKNHILEPELQEMLSNVIDKKNFYASTDIKLSDIYIICVPTPLVSNESQNLPEIKFILDCVNQVSEVIKPGDTIILESTSPVGTTAKIKDLLNKKNIDTSEIMIGYCPERVLPGNIIKEMKDNDRLVGGLDHKSTLFISNFYRSFVDGEVHETSAEVAEMCKLVENSYRDLNIAFANEISILCREMNMNELELIALANKHPRVNILQPGIGVGGHCIAIDPYFIIANHPKSTKLIKTAREVNISKTDWVISDINYQIDLLAKLKKQTPKVSFLGITYKPNVSDIRESPALEIVNRVNIPKENILIVDPNVINVEGFKIYEIEEAILKSDLTICLVKHREFTKEKIKQLITNSNYIDYCNIDLSKKK